MPNRYEQQKLEQQFENLEKILERNKEWVNNRYEITNDGLNFDINYRYFENTRDPKILILPEKQFVDDKTGEKETVPFIAISYPSNMTPQEALMIYLTENPEQLYGRMEEVIHARLHEIIEPTSLEKHLKLKQRITEMTKEVNPLNTEKAKEDLLTRHNLTLNSLNPNYKPTKEDIDFNPKHERSKFKHPFEDVINNSQTSRLSQLTAEVNAKNNPDERKPDSLSNTFSRVLSNFTQRL